ncbi:MAG: nucleoside phosphorylase [Thaumarchaeota archaeon]|nr:MAG: nucleoside phosphorylase [Nitrososphaerota archaeon]
MSPSRGTTKRIASHREYTTYGGYVGKEYIVAMSTGIGAPSAAIAVEELARLGVKVMIRVGTCGAIHPAAKVGSVIIADAAVRLEGTSREYVMEGYPAAAAPEVVMALKEGAASLGKKSMTGVACSTDSFYVGQARRGYGGYFPSRSKTLISDLRAAKVLCFEMESSILFTLGRLFGLKTAALFGVVANRVTNEFGVDAGVEDAIAVAIEGIRRLPKYLEPKDLS